MLLQMMTWPEVEAHLKTSTGIIVPIGSTEQHGPNGLIGTDALTADYIARGVGEAVDAVVAPVINVGIAQHHMGFTGSMTITPSTMILLIKEWVASLSKHGFDRVFFVNGHGGNISTVNAAFAEIHTARSLAEKGNNRPAVRLALRSWWASAKMMKMLKEMYGDKDGMHATISEVSLTQHLFPDAIKSAPEMGPPSDYRGPFGDAEDYRAKFPDGRIGSHPYLATPEAGAKIYDAAVEDVARDYRQFLAKP